VVVAVIERVGVVAAVPDMEGVAAEVADCVLGGVPLGVCDELGVFESVVTCVLDGEPL